MCVCVCVCGHTRVCCVVCVYVFWVGLGPIACDNYVSNLPCMATIMAGMNHDSAMPTCRSLALYGNHHGRHDAVCACHRFMNQDSAMPTCRSLALYGNHHGRQDAVCACHWFMNQDSAMPACKSHHDRNAFVRYHALLGCESLIHVDLILLLFICGTHIFL